MSEVSLETEGLISLVSKPVRTGDNYTKPVTGSYQCGLLNAYFLLFVFVARLLCGMAMHLPCVPAASQKKCCLTSSTLVTSVITSAC